MFNRAKPKDSNWEAHFELNHQVQQLVIFAEGKPDEDSLARIDSEGRLLAKQLGYSLVLEFSACCHSFCLTVWIMWFKDRFWQNYPHLLEVTAFYILGERFRFTNSVELAWTHLCLPSFIRLNLRDALPHNPEAKAKPSGKFFRGIPNRSKDFLAFHK